MTLDEFFNQPDAPTQVEFAAKVGLSQPALNHYLHGRRRLPSTLARQIVEATGGLVTYNDLFGVPNLPKRRTAAHG